MLGGGGGGELSFLFLSCIWFGGYELYRGRCNNLSRCLKLLFVFYKNTTSIFLIQLVGIVYCCERCDKTAVHAE